MDDTPDHLERETLRYDAGTGMRSRGSVPHLDEKLPVEWVVVTRDLVGDWGEINLTGLSFGSTDDQPAWLDHVYLSRTPLDMDSIAAEPHSSRKKP